MANDTLEDTITKEEQRMLKLIEKRGLQPDELKAILDSSQYKPSKTVKHPISGRSVKYGYFSDSHIGHKNFREDVFEHMVRMIKREKPDFMINTGDTLEGMSGRDGHIYELDKIGFQEQFDYAKDLLSQIPVQIYGIDGNHDEWYKNKGNMGIVVGEQLDKQLPNYTHLGEREGWLKLAPNISLYLYHAGDGTAYANSYKLQKLVESFTGGNKPSIVHSGHYHKSLYQFARNVHGFEDATLCDQTPYMRGKKIPAHVGYGFVEVFKDKNGVNRLKHEFVPFYD
jgi:hypothetical protein